MKLHNLPIFLTLISVALVLSHAAVPPEVYWKNVLPNTPMPKAIRNSLPQSEWNENKGTSVSVGKGGVNVNVDPHKGKLSGSHTNVNVGPKGGVGVTTGKPGGGHTDVNVGPKGGIGVSTGKPGGAHTSVSVGPKSGVGVSTGKPSGAHTSVGVGPKSGVGVSTGKPGGGHTSVDVGPKSGVGVSTGKPGKGHTEVTVNPKHGVGVSTGKPGKGHVYVGVKPGPNPFNYIYAASETQLHDDRTKALFFLQKDMAPGSHITVHFTQSSNGAVFLPRGEAESLPFSSAKIPDILREFSVQPNSEAAHTIESTIKDCESKGIQGEEKYCATSLESMVDYAKSTLKNNKIKAVSTETVQTDDNNNMVKYTISGVRKLGGNNDEAVACHKKNYAYAVFYCHKTKATSAYIVSLRSNDGGSVAKAVAVCHKDTSAWNPNHLAFKVLNVKPGSVPICHFLPEDHVLWLSN